MSFLEKTMNVAKMQVDSLMFIALILGTPFFLFFGWLSDRIGRKWIMMAGMLIAIISYRPIYEKMYQTTNIENKIELPAKATVQAQLVSTTAGQDSVYHISKSYSDGTLYTCLLYTSRCV